MRGRATSVVLPALAVLALVAVVGIAATGSTPSGSGRSRAPSDTLLDALFTLWLVAVAGGGVLLVYGLAQRKAIAQEIASGRYRRTPLTAWVALVIALAVIAWVARVLNLRPQLSDATEEPFGRGQLLPTRPGRTATDYQPGISWLVVAVVGALAVAAACAYVLSRRRSRARADGSEDLPAQLALALDDALDDLRTEADPRRAIVAAYARMERVLGASGVPRRSSETADEYLGRVLRELAPDSDAVARLTWLFTQAKFSHHEVDATMKEEAIEALEQVRDDLRPPDERAAAAGGATPAQVSP